MRDLFVNSSLEFLTKYIYYTDNDKEKVIYGLHGLFSFITKLVMLISINLLTGCLIEFSLLMIFYFIIRRYGFGLHAKSNGECWIWTLLMFSFVPLILRHYELNRICSLLLMGIGDVGLIVYAPADTSKRPLLNKKKRLIAKLKVIFISLLYSIYIIFNNDLIAKCLLWSIIFEATMVNPITYFLDRQKFNNYKLFKD